MNWYLEPQGFLGTGASLLADLTLLAYILLLVPGMIAGFVFARRGQHRPQHKTVMIGITLLNWVLIIFLMIVAYNFDVVQNIGQQPGNPRYLIPTIHGVLGLVAQLLATYVIYRMLREDSQVAAAQKRGEKGDALRRYWFLSAKPVMRLTLALWLITALLGFFNYLIRYELLPSFAGNPPGRPVTTEEAPAATPEMTMTEDVMMTEEAPEATESVSPETPQAATTEDAPAMTEEVLADASPAVTPEATP